MNIDQEHDLNPSHYQESLPATTMQRSTLDRLFGGRVERRPAMLALLVSGIVLLGFILGSLFTLGILTDVIVINPKAIKAVLKSLVGK